MPQFEIYKWSSTKAHYKILSDDKFITVKFPTSMEYMLLQKIWKIAGENYNLFPKTGFF